MEAHVNGARLHYAKSGDGPPLLLLHGNGQDHHIFDKIVPRLATTFTVYALDSRNHGQSEMTAAYSYDTMAEDVHAFIVGLGLGRANVVGFSDGAIVALKLAMAHGGMVAAMALLGVNLKPEDFTEKSLNYIRTNLEKTDDPLYRLMLEQPRIGLDDTRQITVPTLLVAAEREIYRPEVYTELAAAMPNAQLKIMTGHNHESYIVNQDILYPDLKEFFSGTTGMNES